MAVTFFCESLFLLECPPGTPASAQLVMRPISVVTGLLHAHKTDPDARPKATTKSAKLRDID